MSNILFRRSAEILTRPTGRQIYGRAVPYDTVTTINDGYGRAYKEKFVYGSFGRSVRERGHKVRLFTCHDRGRLPVGKAVELAEQPDGLHASFEVARTRDGDELLELVATGVVDAFSIGFEPVRDRRDGDTLVRIEAKLVEISAVGLPAYEGAHIAGVRSQHLAIPRSVAQARIQLMNW